MILKDSTLSIPESIKKLRFVFAGDRAFVLDSMLARGLSVINIFYPPGSNLECYLTDKGLSGVPLPDKSTFISHMQNLPFDCFVCNGLKLILPISKLTAGTPKKFINIHPSYLPDLRGQNPIQAALLNGRDSGATCHLLDDGIDTGPIIAQVKIPHSECLDAWLLFQLTFIAERMVFDFALKRQFIPDPSITNTLRDNNIYYTFRKDDLAIDFDGGVQSIVRKIKAFNTPLKGAYFEHNGRLVTVCDVRTINNAFVSDVFCDKKQKTVLIRFDNRIMTKIDDIYLELKLRDGDIDALSVGDSLC